MPNKKLNLSNWFPSFRHGTPCQATKAQCTQHTQPECATIELANITGRIGSNMIVLPALCAGSLTTSPHLPGNWNHVELLRRAPDQMAQKASVNSGQSHRPEDPSHINLRCLQDQGGNAWTWKSMETSYILIQYLIPFNFNIYIYIYIYM